MSIKVRNKEIFFLHFLNYVIQKKNLRARVLDFPALLEICPILSVIVHSFNYVASNKDKLIICVILLLFRI